MSENPLRNIPSVQELLENPSIRQLTDKFSHNVVVGRVRSFLDGLRHDLTAASEIALPTASELAQTIADWIVVDQSPRLRPVINGTGILLHTGLGRAPLAPSAIEGMVAVARGYSSVEVDLRSGKRSQRAKIVESMLIELTGAEAALVVNNNAAATVLALAALAADQEVVVSRGQLVEIGGSYRLPDVMEASGCRLREVGTTNRTRLKDYEAALGEQTAALLRVHPSNYSVVGFTESVPIGPMVDLAHRHQRIAIDDIGSGALLPLEEVGLPGEPVARESIEAGADLVLFSGDKLLGGPQCGIAVGRKEIVERLAQHPLSRALRVDKLTLAALSATLRLYQRPEQLAQTLPLWSLLQTSVDNLKNRAERLAPQLAATPIVQAAEPVAASSQLGGGSVPNRDIPTWCVAVQPVGHRPDALAKRLRLASPSVVGRITQDRYLLDLRTIFPDQDGQLVAAFAALDAAGEPERSEALDDA